MDYPRTSKYDNAELRSRIMGPHPVKLEEELLLNHKIPQGATVLDLGSGQGVTSLFLAQEYGFRVYAADLWSDPKENQAYFDQKGVSRDCLIPVKADATSLPFENDFFDAVVSIDSYNYFGFDPKYLDQYLLPLIKSGGYIYIAIPGMKKDLHDHLPEELLLSWTPEQLNYLHDSDYWRNIISQSNAEIISIQEMESNEEVWNDWLACENEYSINDRAAIQAGGCKYLNFLAFVLRKK